jgi:hypothetical protein
MLLLRTSPPTLAGSALALTLLAGCSGPQPTSNAAGGEVPRPFADALGFDAGTLDRRWRTGDRALYAARFQDGAHDRRWSIRFSVADEERDNGPTTTLAFTTDEDTFTDTSPLHPVHAAVHEDGEDASTVSSAQAPRLFLERGFTGYCEAIFAWRAAEDAGKTVTDEERAEAMRVVAATFGTLSSLLQLIQSVESLQAVLWQVMEKPSLLSLAVNLGVDLTIELGGDVEALGADALPPELRGRPVYRLPLTIHLNGEPALECTLTVTTPAPPLELVAGVVRIDGWRSTDPSRRIVLELLGARLAEE